MSSDRKALLRGSSDIPSMRNWPLFAFLTGLVFFFYVFYIYQAQSTEFAMTRTELDDQIQKVRNLKMEVFNAKAENERLKSSETALKTEKEKFNKEKEECSNSLRTCKLNAENYQSQMKKAEELSALKDKQTKDLQAKIDALMKEKGELAEKAMAQENLAKQLKAELEKLQNELKQPKAEGGANVVAASAAGGAVPAAGGAVPAPGGAAPAAGGAVPAGGAAAADLGGRVAGIGGAAAGVGGAAVGAPEAGVGGAGRKQRSLEVEERRGENYDDKLRQIPNPADLAGNAGLVEKTEEDEKKDAPQVDAPPQQRGDRVKLAVAAQRTDDEDDPDKPVVKGGDYDDKLDVEKGVGDDVQPAQ